MNPEIKLIDAFTVVGLLCRTKGGSDKIPQLWGQLMQRYDEVSNKVNPRVAYGVEGNCDDKSGEFDYLAGYSVASDSEPPQNMVKWNIPAQTYAVFPSTLPNIQEAYSQAYQDWLPNSEYVRASGPEFEFYDESFSPDAPEAVVYLYIPVVKK